MNRKSEAEETAVPAVTAMEVVTAAPASCSHDGRSERGLMAVATAALASSSHDGELGRGYEVFLSFRGPDTRLTIADSLYEAIKHAGIRVFKDDEELRVGKEIRGNLLQAINDSRIYIPIFSKNYASSKWCLRELAHIVKSSRDNAEKVVLPIFYDVDADDVKLKTELYRQDLQKHKNDSGKDTSKEWEEALKEVARIKGWNLKDYRLHRLTNLMVEEVSSLLWTRRTDMPNHLVGIKDRMDHIMKLLDLRAFDVRFIVIHGMGGIGKTTLAEAIFRHISPQFRGHCCFLKDVRTNDIINLQNKLLFDILNLSRTNLSFIDEGADVIKTRFLGKKVLIVLDDIDNKDQIMGLAGEPNWFGGGSRIIITTRNIDFMVKEGEDDNLTVPSSGQFSFYNMSELNSHDALQLFCERALGCAKSPPGYVDITKELINALGGLPLALTVVGSMLRGKCRRTWEDALCKLKLVMNEDVKKKLMISYEALEPNQQQIYLDITCFFINKDKTIVVKYWDTIFGYPTEIEVNILKRMSLIKISSDNKLRMHDQLRDLGRSIVHPMRGETHMRGSRLWSPQDAFHGTKDIVALNLGTLGLSKTYRFKRKQFMGLVNLRFLQLDHGNFEGDFKDLFSELRWLSWSNCPSKFRANNFGLKNLTILMLSGNNITKDWGGWRQIMLSLASDVDLDARARMTEGFSGVDLQALLSNAQPQAVHDLLDSREGVFQLQILIVADYASVGVNPYNNLFLIWEHDIYGTIHQAEGAGEGDAAAIQAGRDETPSSTEGSPGVMLYSALSVWRNRWLSLIRIFAGKELHFVVHFLRVITNKDPDSIYSMTNAVLKCCAMVNMEEKIPDIEKCLEIVATLQAKKSSGEALNLEIIAVTYL
ncbi:TMV resistance protein N-like [Eucalyptus grandis]|uniref:TMV resistance protein N-like n=1 Tax=Eucalyptus grandis TaxID=71139 RepID=UPI00192ED3C9|nr:TMV resistance protein N-like [Eucalyptus grandis]